MPNVRNWLAAVAKTLTANVRSLLFCGIRLNTFWGRNELNRKGIFWHFEEVQLCVSSLVDKVLLSKNFNYRQGNLIIRKYDFFYYLCPLICSWRVLES